MAAQSSRGTPMVLAEELAVAAPGVAVWHAYDPGAKCDLWSTALRTAEGWIVIDPIELAPAALRELEAYGRLSAILLTSGNHGRAAEAFRARHGIPIWAPRDAGAELSFAPDREFSEGDLLPGALRAIAIPSAGPGEVALIGSGVLCFGDAVIHFGSAGFSLLPAKYCANPSQLPNDLRKLLSYDFRILTFAHGDPIVHQARESLQTLLA
jgi:hypothetical protein